jgi:hypothetical protein
MLKQYASSNAYNSITEEDENDGKDYDDSLTSLQKPLSNNSHFT